MTLISFIPNKNEHLHMTLARIFMDFVYITNLQKSVVPNRIARRPGQISLVHELKHYNILSYFTQKNV